MTASPSDESQRPTSGASGPDSPPGASAGVAGRPLAEWIPLAQAADELPRRRRGRKTHVSTLYRWTTTGCRGVRLEFAMVGATRCTTRAALARFVARLTSACSSESMRPSAPTEAAARKAAERADRILDADGI
jgi:Protein of unknown function (DUF1580)